MTHRPAGKAGSWYPDSALELKVVVDQCVGMAEKKWPLDSALLALPPVAVVVPHAGLMFSGPLAAAAFSLIRKAYTRVDRFVVFGACHRMTLARPAIWADGEWDTPLGPIAVDSRAADSLVKAGLVDVNEPAHHDDNSIELQTPFMKELFPEAAIVPIAMGPFPDSFAIGMRIGEVSENWDGVSIAVGSTDLTHYGKAFGLTPAGFGQPALDWTKKNDQRFLDALTAMDGQEILKTAHRDGSACGAGAAAATAGWARIFGAEQGHVLGHTTSHDVLPDDRAEHFVGYGAVVF